MAGKIRELTTKQLALITKLSTYPYPSLKKAAEDLDIPFQTARKWNIQDKFREPLKAAMRDNEREVKDRANMMLLGLVEKAVKTKLGNLEQTSSYQVRHLESTWILERLLGTGDQQSGSSEQLEMLMRLLTSEQHITIAGLPDDLAEFERPNDLAEFERQDEASEEEDFEE